VSGQKTKVLILVKTYPTLSTKYSELVCTAGIREDGTWIRIYPVPFRLLEREKKYKKYQWIEADLIKSKSDPRPESFKIANIDSLKLLDVIDSKDNWAKRKMLLAKTPVFQDLKKLIACAKDNTLSLGILKPSEIKDFIIENSEREWDKKKVAKIKFDIKQPSLFSTEEEKLAKETFELVPKVPYKFSYRLADAKGNESTMMIEDWEIGQLYWNCLKLADGNEQRACEKIRQKYFEEFKNKDLLLFLGTTRQFHSIAPNPFLIIGIFYPPKSTKDQSE